MQATATLNGPPVAASCSAYEADWPALMVAAPAPGGTMRERLPLAAFTVTFVVVVALAWLLSVTVAVTVYVPAIVYVWPVLAVLTGALPSPKSIVIEAMLPPGAVEPAVFAEMASGAVPMSGATFKTARGGGGVLPPAG